MEDLSDGVNKLTEFSAVLSSVTRALDKNVRRLEDQFGKCNDSLKKMDETVSENSKIAVALKEENEAQVLALQDAVAKATAMPECEPSSNYMLAKEEYSDVRPTSLIILQEEEAKDAKAYTEKEEKLYSEIQPWSRLVDEATSSDKIYTNKVLNSTLHKQNKSLRVPSRVETKEGQEGAEPAARDPPEGAFPFPEIKQGDGVGHALSAMIQRMHRLENAVNLQTSLNEALVKMVRDDTQVKAVYDTIARTVNVLHDDMREIGISQAKLRSTLKGLGDFVHDYELKMQDVAPDGRLRVKSRRERGAKNEDGVAIEGDIIENGLDAYTVTESDRLDRRITLVESQLSANGAMGVALRRLDSTCEELQSQMVEREEEISALKKFQEENSSATFLLKKAIIASQGRWDNALADINFGIHDYTNKFLVEAVEDGSDDEEGGEEYEDEEENENGVDGASEDGGISANSSISRAKNKVKRLYDDDPVLLKKLHDLFSAIENVKSCSMFAIHENLDDTLDILCPALDDLTLMVEEVFAYDTEVRLDEKSAEESKGNPPPVVTLAELMTEDRKYNMKESLFEAARSSIPIIDERVDKISLRRRIEKIEGEAVHKKDIDEVNEKQKNMSETMKSLTSKEEMARAMNKAAKKTDLMRFREVMFQRLELNEHEIESLNTIVEEHWEHSLHDDADLRAVAFANDSSGNQIVGKSSEYGNQKTASPSTNVTFVNAPRFGGGGGGASSEEVKEMSTRVDLIFNQFKDLQKSCETFIPREEVQEALKATLYELKLLKMNTINVNKFNEEIEKKADYDEMKKLMEVLSSALGDLMGKNVSAAAKSRCLMCDKPVASAVRESTRGRSGSPSRSPSRTESQDRNAPNRGPLDMANNNKYDGDATSPRPGTSQPRLSSSRSASALPTPQEAARAKARITSEVTVLKNSMELPAIESGTPQARPPGKVQDQYKSRVRSSAGGGNVMY